MKEQSQISEILFATWSLDMMLSVRRNSLPWFDRQPELIGSTVHAERLIMAGRMSMREIPSVNRFETNARYGRGVADWSQLSGGI